MAGETGAAPPAPGPRWSPMLVASLAVSGLSLALPAAFGPLGPLAAGILAFLGYRNVRAAGGAVRGPLLARGAMTLALALLVVQSWAMVRHAPTAAAWASIREHAARVDANLRTGTPEAAWDLLAPEARVEAGRAAFVTGLRDALSRLGPLQDLGATEGNGGDWERTGTFEEGDSAELRLPMRFDARFERGRGRVEIEVLLRRRGSSVTGALTSLRVAPLDPAPAPTGR